MKTGYNVLLKDEVTGRFKVVNNKPVSKNRALNLGFSVTDKFSENTFKIKKTKKKVTGNPTILDSMLEKKFNKQGNIYKERKKFRKDNVSEIFSYLSGGRF